MNFNFSLHDFSVIEAWLIIGCLSKIKLTWNIYSKIANQLHYHNDKFYWQEDIQKHIFRCHIRYTMMRYWPVQPVWQYPVLSWNSQHWVWSPGTGGWAPRPSSPSRWSASLWGTWCHRCGRSSYWLAILLKWNLKVHVSQTQLKVHLINIWKSISSLSQCHWWSELNQPH